MPDLPGSAMERIQDHLTFLYGQEQGAATGEKLRRLLRQFLERNPELPKAGGDPTERLSEADAVLITYGDQVREANRPPLQTLAGFLQDYLSGVVSTVHILPFFPYSSDDGFSVIDYTVVDPDLGTWADVARIGRSFRLMFDAVINHISAESDWFRAFRQDEAPYSDFFIVVEPGTDLSLVTRPRALPLLTPIETPSGKKLVWTTFSADQIDLNYANPELLLAILQVLLLYVEQGADILRLDAIAYLW
jgi:glycosidase